VDKLTKPYKEHLFERLRDPVEAGGYLAACLEEGDPEDIALCLQDIAQAHEVPVDITLIAPRLSRSSRDERR